MANRFFISGGVDNNWDTSGNWSATDGGAASGVKPTSADAVFFTSNSPNCTVNTAGVGASLNFTGYTNTITMTAGLTISGSVTLVAAMTIAGAAALAVDATATLTSNGKTWPTSLILRGATTTFTLADNWTVSGTLTLGSATNNVIVNGFQISVSANLTHGGSTGNITGTTLIILVGTGTVTGATGIGTYALSTTINTAGTITFLSGDTFRIAGGTWTRTAGTVVTTNHTLVVNGTVTFDLAGINWNIVNVTGAGSALTFSNPFNVLGLLSLGSTTQSISFTGSTINASGGIRHNGSTGIMSGTTVFTVKATSTLDGPSVTTGRIDNPVTIDAPGATVTISAAFRILLDQLKLTAVSSIITAAGTWTLGSSAGGPLIGPGRLVRT